MSQSVRFGILGAGNIARRIAASLAKVEGAELEAVSCRSLSKAEAFLDTVEHAAGARAYGSHAELVADGSLDAIYVAVPHDLHYEWVSAALKAGIPTISEKPAMLCAQEMREMSALARERQVLFMEAMKPRFQPIYPKVQEMVAELGDILHISVSLMNDMLPYVAGSGTYHMTPGPGAGVLLDCGTYCANWVAAFTDADAPIEVMSSEARLINGVDVAVIATLQAGPVAVEFECAFDRASPRDAILVGTRGELVVKELHRPQEAILTLDGHAPRQIVEPYVVDDFYGEIEHFVQLVRSGATESDIMGLDDSIRVAEVLDAIREAALG